MLTGTGWSCSPPPQIRCLSYPAAQREGLWPDVPMVSRSSAPPQSRPARTCSYCTWTWFGRGLGAADRPAFYRHKQNRYSTTRRYIQPNNTVQHSAIYTDTKQTQLYIYRHHTNNTVRHSIIYEQYSSTQRYIYRHRTNNTVQHSFTCTDTKQTIQYHTVLHIQAANKQFSTTQRYIYRHQTNTALYIQAPNKHSVIYTDTKQTIQYHTALHLQAPNKQFSTTQRYIYRHQTNNTVQHGVILLHTQQYSSTQRYTYTHT